MRSGKLILRRRNTSGVHAQRKSHVRTQRRRLSASKEEKPYHDNPTSTLVLDFQPPEPWDSNTFLSLKLPCDLYDCSLSRLLYLYMWLSTDCVLRSLGVISCFPSELKSRKGGLERGSGWGQEKRWAVSKTKSLQEEKWQSSFQISLSQVGEDLISPSPFFRRQEEFG